MEIQEKIKMVAERLKAKETEEYTKALDLMDLKELEAEIKTLVKERDAPTKIEAE